MIGFLLTVFLAVVLMIGLYYLTKYLNEDYHEFVRKQRSLAATRKR